MNKTCFYSFQPGVNCEENGKPGDIKDTGTMKKGFNQAMNVENIQTVKRYMDQGWNLHDTTCTV